MEVLTSSRVCVRVRVCARPRFTVGGSSAQAFGQCNLATATEVKRTTNGTTWRCPRAGYSFAVWQADLWGLRSVTALGKPWQLRDGISLPVQATVSKWNDFHAPQCEVQSNPEVILLAIIITRETFPFY